jgi:uncharacterized protein (TIGR03790 family)
MKTVHHAVAARSNRRAARILGLAGLAVSAIASPGAAGPENSLLIIDPSNPVSLYVGNHYKSVRNLPDSSVLYLDPAAPNHAVFAAANIPAVQGALHNAGTANLVDFIIIAPGGTFFIPRSGEITDQCFPVERIAISSAYTMSFIADEVLAGTKSTLANGYYSTSSAAVVFDSEIKYYQGKASNDERARRYYIGALLGYTGHNGNTVEELVAMIDRAAAADGTRPEGTFYFMNNENDPARNVRANSFPGVVTNLQAIGFAAEVLDGILPLGREDALGIMTGAAEPNILSQQYDFAPGAPFADHLTSYAGTFDSDSQTKMSKWITKGAVGTVGATEEPCNYNGKFPHARLHLYYAQGAPLGTAYYRSAGFVPFQMLFYGDPLARPFAYIPEVSVPDAPSGAVSGTIQLSPSATTEMPGGSVIAFDTLIDGVKGSLTIPGQKVTIDTTLLADGFHDLRILAYDVSPLKTQGAWTGLLEVDNHGRAAAATALTTSGDLGTLFGIDLSASGGAVAEVRLVQSGRTVAAIAGPSGRVDVFGQTLGAGRVMLQAEALFKDGRTARSEPITLDIEFAGGGPGPAPEAFSYTKKAPTLDAALLVELPSTFSDDPGAAATSVLSGPSQATVLLSDGSPYILIRPDEDASGLDTITFQVTTQGGTSAPATVTVDYGDAAPPCEADLNGDGVLDLFDFLAFTNLFNAKEPGADCAADGVFDLFDFLCFVNAFNAGC